MSCWFCEAYGRECEEKTEEFFCLQLCSYHRRCIVKGLDENSIGKLIDILMEVCARGTRILRDEEEEADKRLAAIGWTRREETRRSFEELR